MNEQNKKSREWYVERVLRCLHIPLLGDLVSMIIYGTFWILFVCFTKIIKVIADYYPTIPLGRFLQEYLKTLCIKDNRSFVTIRK